MIEELRNFLESAAPLPWDDSRACLETALRSVPVEIRESVPAASCYCVW